MALHRGNPVALALGACVFVYGEGVFACAIFSENPNLGIRAKEYPRSTRPLVNEWDVRLPRSVARVAWSGKPRTVIGFVVKEEEKSADFRPTT